MAMTSGTPYSTAESSVGNGSGTVVGTDRTVDRMRQGAHETVDRLAERAKPAIDRAAESMHSATDSLHARVDRLAEVEERWMETARQTVRDNPVATIAIAVGVGMLLSKLMSSSSR